ncbi:kinase-like domain-containing protein [Aspergillus multicolor]|uniref:casein kinase family protein n=1 Tax=Aspergillus multicolor TaxID=41759 RepID=UPI003CCD355C
MAFNDWISHIGPFEVLEWPVEACTVGIARHQVTQERVFIKREWFRPLVHEALTLQAAAGGVGIPALHWLQNIKGKDVALLDPYGQTLEEAFHQSGRYFGMQTLLGLGYQLLSRVEFLHSRNIVHGNLSPWSFAFGLGWQNQQLLLIDMHTESHAKTVLDDLNAVYHILGYLYSGSECWEHYKQGDLPPFLQTFGHNLSKQKQDLVDYRNLQNILINAHCDLAANAAIALGLNGPRAMNDGLAPSIGALATLATTALFDRLTVALADTGEILDRRPYSVATVLQRFENIMDIYLILLVRDRPSSYKARHLVQAYYLPNRLWRDMQWFLSKAEGYELQLALYAQAYRFMTALFEIKQGYVWYWAGYLLYLARARKELEADCGKAAWIQTTFYWQGVVKRLATEMKHYD